MMVLQSPLMQDGHGRGIQCGSDRHEWSLNERGRVSWSQENLCRISPHKAGEFESHFCPALSQAEGRVPVFRMAPWGWDATTLPDGHLLVRGPGEGLTSLT